MKPLHPLLLIGCNVLAIAGFVQLVERRSMRPWVILANGILLLVTGIALSLVGL